MKRKQYESPDYEVLVYSPESNFCVSGEKVTVVSGYSWDEEEDEE